MLFREQGIEQENNPCEAKYKLTMSGIVIVPQEEVANYCIRGGCADNFKTVLQCIHQVKRDFWFVNKAPYQFIDNAITHGCSTTTGINTTTYKKS
ncbi:hypothetical protein QYF36_025204 [Acer negundo]|nr:hypothetical protein QYF36_025204 [Acer negundo]